MRPIERTLVVPGYFREELSSGKQVKFRSFQRQRLVADLNAQTHVDCANVATCRQAWLCRRTVVGNLRSLDWLMRCRACPFTARGGVGISESKNIWSALMHRGSQGGPVQVFTAEYVQWRRAVGEMSIVC